MVSRDILMICHGCGGQVFPGAHHWRARLINNVVFFHPKCYIHYKKHAQNASCVKWAEEKDKREN